MTEWHVTIQKYCHVTVEADTPEGAQRKAEWDDRTAEESGRVVERL